jgi:hypothetical protein
MKRLVRGGLIAIGIAGCAPMHQPAPTTQPSAATTQPDYWLQQKPVAKATFRDFQLLWNACEETARDYGFSLDRQDYRGGVITTVPLVSKQFFEFWRNDAQTAEDVANSSLNTYRRTLQFKIAREPAGGGYSATPEVLIERYVQAERPITSSVYLRNAFRSTRGLHPVGTRESDRGIFLPQRYWYATGRDEVLEADVAKHVRHKLDL